MKELDPKCGNRFCICGILSFLIWIAAGGLFSAFSNNGTCGGGTYDAEIVYNGFCKRDLCMGKGKNGKTENKKCCEKSRGQPRQDSVPRKSDSGDSADKSA
jgi:hypothetical protein